MTRRIAFAISLVAISLAACTCCCGGAGRAKPQPNDDIDVFISRFGQPDRTESTEHDKPRPPIVTKLLIYEKENLRASYILSGSRWKFIGFQNNKTDNPISASDAMAVMAHRDNTKAKPAQ